MTFYVPSVLILGRDKKPVRPYTNITTLCHTIMVMNSRRMGGHRKQRRCRRRSGLIRGRRYDNAAECLLAETIQLANALQQPISGRLG